MSSLKDEIAGRALAFAATVPHQKARLHKRLTTPSCSPRATTHSSSLPLVDPCSLRGHALERLAPDGHALPPSVWHGHPRCRPAWPLRPLHLDALPPPLLEAACSSLPCPAQGMESLSGAWMWLNGAPSP